MRIPSVTTVLALLAFCLANPSFASSADYDAYFQSGYGYCDTKVLADYWKTDITEAKTRIGQHNRAGTMGQLQKSLDKARKKLKSKKRVVCEFWETDYRYEDAEALAMAWGVDVAQAKLRIGRAVTIGQGARIDQELKALGRAPGQVPPEEEALDAFWSSQHAYCDAELLAALWGADVYQVKISMGLKIQGGDHELLHSELDRAREAARASGTTCDFWTTPYTPDDAAALASFWGVDLLEAKSRIGAEYTASARRVLDPALQAARGGR